MNYLEQERQDALAVSYVLGSMRGKARLRFQGLLMQHLSLRQAVWRWERHLNPVVEQLKPVMPDANLWQRITVRLGWSAFEPAPAPRSYWKETFALALAACLALVLLLPRLEPVGPQVPAQLAIVQNSQAQALWVVKWEQQQLKVQATAAVQPLTDADYELWMLPENGQPPISLGLLPQQANTERALPPSVNGLKVAALAVSLEPRGGSPTGQPTGPVLHTAQLIQL
ncbi:MAG: anti-sigma factor [Gammaproteobacteria bacterium]|jgi:anti-sigma-K factor RskA|nr:anti-sigma factor [Gammaproteobacteria bacterium]MBU2426404.1 anti-sigma factor [Gammaproteobacteria bacterium]